MSMNLRLKRARELAGYAVQLTKDEGLPTMLKRGAGFVKRRCFGQLRNHYHELLGQIFLLKRLPL